MSGQTHVLVVEDDEAHVDRLRRQLSRQPLWTGSIEGVRTLVDAETVLRTRQVDCVLVDLALTDAHGADVISTVRTISSRSPIIVLSGHDELESAREAVRLGAQDYLLKDRLDGTLLMQSVTLAVERKRVEVEVARLAYHDELTGLPNHAFLTEELDRSLRRHSHRSVGLIMLDLDGFAAINTDLGHRAGDLVLAEIAQRLEDATRDADLIARIGADEFAVVCEQLETTDEIDAIVHRLVEAIDRPMVLPGATIRMSATAGVAVAPDRSTPEALMAAARAGITSARRDGRPWWRDVSADAMPVTLGQTDLQRALERNELVVHYQPIIDLRDRSMRGVEALVRWEHPDRGLIGPNAFLAHVQSQETLAGLDRWVIARACADIADFSDSLEVHVNVSLGRDANDHLLDGVEEALGSSGLAPERLAVEVVERSAGLQLSRSAATLRALSASGVRVAVDDFGVGYSTLDVVLRADVDMIKIDPSFVADAVRNPRARSILASMRSMAADLGLRLVVEGIETEEQPEIATAAGCDTGQGYLYSRPQP
ncbi:MAG: GGDEF domain-containing response regulator, partial [Actinomycetota bacterium]